MYVPTYTHMHTYTGKGFYDSLRMTNTDVTPSRLELTDICDGEMYHEFRQKQIQDTRNGIISISFTLNTDGALLFQSKNSSIWPVLLMINELPFSERFVYI